MEKTYSISTRKIQIYVDEPNIDLRNSYYKILRDYQYTSYKYANEIIRLAFFTDILKSGIGSGENKLTGKEFTEKLFGTFGSGSSPMNFGYKYASELFKVLPSTIRASLKSIVFSCYNEDKKEVMKGNKSVRNYKRNMPVPFMKTAINNLKVIDNGFSFDLFGISFKTILGRDKSNNKAILINVINGTYPMCDSSFTFEDNKLFLLIVLKIPNTDYILDENKVLGVDLGINIPVVAFCDDKYVSIGNKEDFFNQRLRVQKARRMLNKNLIFTKGGKGRTKKLAKLETFRDREANFAKTYNHQVSKKIIDFALINQCATINMEDLSSISSDRKNTFILRNWAYAQLKNMVEYKAKKVGIIVRSVKPEYTSQCCSKCGYIDSDNRLTQAKFICQSCGLEENADINAAKNISMAHEEFFIKRVEAHKKSIKKLAKIES